MQKKVREHSEWFRKVMDRKCPCGAKTQVYSWGEYASGSWRTVDRFCESCFSTRVKRRLIDHAAGCGCSFKLNFRGGARPIWINIDQGEGSCVPEIQP